MLKKRVVLLFMPIIYYGRVYKEYIDLRIIYYRVYKKKTMTFNPIKCVFFDKYIMKDIHKFIDPRIQYKDIQKKKLNF